MTANPPNTAWKAMHIPAHLPANLRDCFAAQQAAFAQGGSGVIKAFVFI